MTQNEQKLPQKPGDSAEKPEAGTKPPMPKESKAPKEYGGPTGPEPTRYGDWERNGKVSDF